MKEQVKETYTKTKNIWSKIRPRIFPVLNFICYIAVIIVNILAAVTTVIGGTRTDVISDRNPALFTPAGYAFSIWGLIYTLLGIFCVVQFPFIYFGDNIAIFEKIGFLFIITCGLNIVWIFIWGYNQIVAAAVIISLFLFTLALIYYRLDIGYGREDRKKWQYEKEKELTTKDQVVAWIKFLVEFYCVQVPFSVYTGWLTAATIANISAAGFKDPFGVGEVYTATILITFTTVPAIALLAYKKDVFYASVIFWAVFAIGVRQKLYETVYIAVIVNCSLVGVGIGWTILYLFKEIVEEKGQLLVDYIKGKNEKEIRGDNDSPREIKNSV